MDNILVAIALLLACTGVGLFLGALLTRAGRKNDPPDDTGFVGNGLSATLGTVGGLLAFVLGFLVVFTLNNYTDAQDVASNEASAYSSAFESSTLLPADTSAPVQRDLVCLARSVQTYSWYVDSSVPPSADDTVEAWWIQTRSNLTQLQERTPLEEYATETIFSSLSDARSLGEKRALLSTPSIPPIIWLIIYLVFAVTIALTYICLRFNLFVLLSSIGVLTVVVGIVMGALITFANPFSVSDGTAVSADDLSATLTRLADTYPGAAWEPCGRPGA